MSEADWIADDGEPFDGKHDTIENPDWIIGRQGEEIEVLRAALTRACALIESLRRLVDRAPNL